MDNEFLDIYEDELRFIREMGKEFAKSHPKIASRLDLTSQQTQDPYVERLLEGFAFLTARVRLRMEAQYPEFTQNLLGLLYPNLIAPTPSCGIFEFEPDFREGALVDGFTIPRGTSMLSRPEGTDTACEFITTSDVTLRPLVVDEAEYTDQPSLLERWLPETPKMEAAIRLRIRIASDAPLASLNLDPLTFFISGDGAQPDRLLQSLVMDARKIVAHPVDPDYTPSTSNPLKVEHNGFTNEERLLPHSAKTFSGHRLLQEAFIMIEKFRFVSLTGLEKSLEGADVRVFDVVFGLTKAVPEFATSVVPEAFRLHCVPAVNLFQRRADRITVNPGQSEHNVVVDRTRPQGYEVYDILSIDGITEKNADRLKFEPIFQPGNSSDTRKAHGYFNARRSNRLISANKLDTGYLGTDVHVRLSSIGRGPAPMNMDQLIIHTLCTNRGLPLLLTNKSKFSIQSAVPVKKINTLVRPTAPRPPLAQDDAGWDLVNALSLNHLSFASGAEVNAGWLTRLLGLFIDKNNDVHRQYVKAFEGLEARVINRRLPGEGPVSYCRGLEISLIADTESLRGTGPFILASVLERFFTRAATMNSFTQTVLKASDRSRAARWPVRNGGRHVL